MKKVLVVEDSPSQGIFQLTMIRQKLNYPVHIVKSKKELEETLKKSSEDFFAAIVDMMLPDALHGEALSVVLEYHIPAIVYTSIDAITLREEMHEFPIVDYVTKSDPINFEYVLKLLKFIHEYGKSKILIVDDSKTDRMQIKNVLDGFGFEIFQAESGEKALSILEANPDIIFITMDKVLPGMDGLETIKNIRRSYDYSQVSILGISSSQDRLESVRFIKSGANDFIYKPFLPEELLLRVVNNIELISLIREANERAIRDFMTKMYNRKYVFEDGLIEYNKAIKEGKSVVLAMIDIDHFKAINDNYGHPVGDSAIILLADLLNFSDAHASFSARIGGEEFLLMWVDESLESATKCMQMLMEKLALEYVLSDDGEKINFTVSIGMVSCKSDDFEIAFNDADKALYKAKQEGRNRICYL